MNDFASVARLRAPDWTPVPVSNLFSPTVRDALVRASQIEDDSKSRLIAIGKATDLARRIHPQLFKQE